MPAQGDTPLEAGSGLDGEAIMYLSEGRSWSFPPVTSGYPWCGPERVACGHWRRQGAQALDVLRTGERGDRPAVDILEATLDARGKYERPWYTLHMRIFIAIQLPRAFRASICNACDGLRKARPGLRWVDPENMHMTLAFLGELDNAGVERAIQAARLAIKSATTDHAISAFELCTAGLLTFPRRGQASVLAAAVGTGAREVTVLAEYLEQALERVGDEAGLPFRPREHRPFSPHITVARAARPGVVLSASERSTPLVTACLAGTMAVYRSELGSGGAHYEILEELAFCGDIDQ